MDKILVLLAVCCLPTLLCTQVAIYDSGGPIMPEQAAYDVTFYDLALRIFPDEQRIEGAVEVRARVVHPLNFFVLDLDTTLQVSRIQEQGVATRFHYREGGKIWIALDRTAQPGEELSLTVSYAGKPRPAPMAPWDGGFSWSRTPEGAHWIATSCQTEGADLWWPTKDHVSDEPDSMALHIRVPDPLVVASNGKHLRTEQHDDRSATYHWYISTPINSYNVALNIAPYRKIEGEMECVNGETYPLVFYVLPNDYEKGALLFEEIKTHLAFYEKYLGPYPFRADKYGVAQTPHLGMEHQTIIAYGANFDNRSMTGGMDWGFDALHHHELGHEWWGNLITNFDWRDMWIHEGFCTYMQALYMEDQNGPEEYRRYLKRMRRFANRLAVAPLETRSSEQIYRAPIYSKGAWVLHSLRYVMGDEAFLAALRKMCYPTVAMEAATNGEQCRFVTTADWISICEELSGQELDWFFDLYVRQPKLPTLRSKVVGNTLTLRWETPRELPFPMPVDVQLGDEIRRVDVTRQGSNIQFGSGIQPVVDPNGWLLMEIEK